MTRHRFETPIQEELAKELFDFWEEVFGPEDPDIPVGVFLGEEAAHNRHVVLLDRDEGVLAGTCGIMTPRANREFAGIGEVATRPEYRGQGIANRLCEQALGEFAEQGGDVVFLGTENPAAARIYHRLGWRRIANSTVYANVTKDDSPEEYLADYFRTPSTVNIAPGDASLRVPMIPLLLTPHHWQVLDGNLPTPMISTRYAEQNSCMGLYRKYQYLLSPSSQSEGGRERAQREHRGMLAQWFAAKTDDGRLVGIATAYVDAENVCHVDGFVHTRFNDSYEPLMGAAIKWGERQNTVRFTARLSVEDEEKQVYFESFGFRPGGEDGKFSIGDRDVPAQSMLLN
ncbi:MAG: GNAT family N-acetyltransferase [Chloroflexi bacterium]|nr:GNAT family N-acetyltransferase [Chloroflexota bacterium]